MDHGSDTVLLHTLLWVPEGRDIAFQVNGHNQKMTAALGGSPYLVCRMFWSEDTSRSQVCWGTTAPQFGFKQVSFSFYGFVGLWNGYECLDDLT